VKDFFRIWNAGGISTSGLPEMSGTLIAGDRAVNRVQGFGFVAQARFRLRQKSSKIYIDWTITRLQSLTGAPVQPSPVLKAGRNSDAKGAVRPTAPLILENAHQQLAAFGQRINPKLIRAVPLIAAQHAERWMSCQGHELLSLE
jgi:hypothetical protein